MKRIEVAIRNGSIEVMLIDNCFDCFISIHISIAASKIWSGYPYIVGAVNQYALVSAAVGNSLFICFIPVELKSNPDTSAAAPELPSSPNAQSSGFIRPSCAGPFELKNAADAKESTAATTILFFDILKPQ
jgi:hypothetical protein